MTKTDPTTIVNMFFAFDYEMYKPQDLSVAEDVARCLYTIHGAQQHVQHNGRIVGWAPMDDAGTKLKFWLRGSKRGFGSLPTGLAGIEMIGSQSAEPAHPRTGGDPAQDVRPKAGHI